MPRPLLIAIFAAVFACPQLVHAQAVPPHCPTDQILSDFNAGDVEQGFAGAVKQRGTVSKSQDPLDAANSVAEFSASGKSGGRVGKAHLIYRFDPASSGSRIVMQGRFLFPQGSFIDSVILMDLECASCGLDTNPGVRLYLREGRLRVDRSKIGIKQSFLPLTPNVVTFDEWHRIVWVVVLGDDMAGSSQVFLDDALVIDAKGTTVLLQQVVDALAPGVKVLSQADRFQIGLTANSNRNGSSLMLDDVAFCFD